jgi:hypothetical protein
MAHPTANFIAKYHNVPITQNKLFFWYMDSKTQVSLLGIGGSADGFGRVEFLSQTKIPHDKKGEVTMGKTLALIKRFHFHKRRIAEGKLDKCIRRFLDSFVPRRIIHPDLCN